MALEGGDRGPATHDHRVEPPQEVPPEMQALLNKPISELSLSVRARKCMSKLNIQTVGDLIKRQRRRAAGVQELRRDLAQRGPRQAGHAGAETQERLTSVGRRTGGVRRRWAPAEPANSDRGGIPFAPLPLTQLTATDRCLRRFGSALAHLDSDRAASRAGRSGSRPWPGTRASSARLGRLETPHGTGRDAGLHAGGHPGHREGSDARPAPRHRHAHAPGQHVSPGPPARRGDGRGARRAARVHGLGRPDPDRFGRVPGLQPGGSEPGHRPGRDVPLAHRRPAARIDPRAGRGHPGSARGRRGHVPGPLPRAAGQPKRRSAEPVDRTIAWAARCKAAHTPGRPVALRDRPGRTRTPTSASGVPRPCSRSTSMATRSAGSASARAATRSGRPSSVTTHLLPADRPRYLMGVGPAAGHPRRRRHRHRPLRLRPADTQWPQRNLFHEKGIGKVAQRRAPPRSRPIEEGCECLACRRFSRAYLRHCSWPRRCWGRSWRRSTT